MIGANNDAEFITYKIASSKMKLVCVSDAIVIEDSKFKWCFFVVEDVQVIEDANVLMWI